MDIILGERAVKVREAIYRISQAAISNESLEELYHSIHDILGELMPVENFYIALYDPANNLLSFPYFVDQYDRPSPPKEPGHGLTEYVLHAGQSLLASPEVFKKLVRQGNVELVGTSSVDWLGVPLKANGVVIGVMVTQSYSEGTRFGQEEKELLEFVSGQVAQAIERRRSEERTRLEAERAKALVRIADRLNAQLDLTAVLNTVCEETAHALNVSAAWISLYDPNRAVFNYAAGLGLPSQFGKTYQPPSRELVDTIASRYGTLLPDVQVIPGVPNARLYTSLEVRTIAFTIMKREKQIIGTLSIPCFGEVRVFTQDELALLQALGDHAAQAIANAQLFQDAERRSLQLQALRTIDYAVTASPDLSTILDVVLDQITEQLSVDSACLLLFNSLTQTLDYAAGHGFCTPVLQYTRLLLGQGYAGVAAKERKTIYISDLRGRDTDFLRSPHFKAEKFITYLGVPLVVKEKIKGVLEIFQRSLLQPDQNWLKFLDNLAGQTAIAIDNAELFIDLQRSNAELILAYDATIDGWSYALDLRDNETEGHTWRVTDMTLRLGRDIGISEDELVHIRRGAMLHDIGKLGVPDSILLKPGPLTDEERKLMQKHPDYAYEMLSPINFLNPALDIPYCHHEKWDGTGYPRRLGGEGIPRAARIFAVVDVWDALTSNRPYRKAWTKDESLDYIQEQDGKYFDPQVIARFLKMKPKSIVWTTQPGLKKRLENIHDN
jgi:HD-GYP domain-containing protein (c-di-GMP phosphodiesterase class II)